MKTNIGYLSFVFVIVLLILTNSCEKNDDIQSKLDMLDGKGYFPLQVGNYWKYSDLLIMEIDAITVIDGIEYFRFITNMDTTFYRKSPDGKIFYLKHGKAEILLYDLSAEVGETWTKVKNSEDSSYVRLSSKSDSVELNNHFFYNCYQFSFDGYNSIVIDDESSTWLAPNIGQIQFSGGVGIVKLEEVQIDGIKITF